MFEYDTVNRWVFRRLRKVSSDGADVTSGGRLFQTWGPATGKALSPTVDRLDCGWMRRLVLAKRRARRLGKSATRTNGPRYDGAQPWRTLYVSTAILNWMRSRMRSQCRLISASDTWSERRKPKISHAAAFKTDCRRPDGYVMVFLEFQKWPSPMTKVRNNNVITGHVGLLPPPSDSEATVWRSEVESHYRLITGHNGLVSPTELTDWPLAPESYIIIHHVITRYYVASDCWSTDSSKKYISCMSRRPTHNHRPTCGFQAAIRNTRNATACDAIKKTKYAMRAREKRNAHIDSLLACVLFWRFLCACSACIAFFDLRRITCVHRVRCVAYDSWGTDLQIRFLHSDGGGLCTCRATSTDDS